MLVDCVTHFRRHEDRLLGVVDAGQWIVENDKKAVAHEAFHGSPVAGDQLAEAGVVLAKNCHHLFGLGGLGERCKAAQIAENDGHLATVALKQRVVIARCNNEVGDLSGQKPSRVGSSARFPINCSATVCLRERFHAANCAA